LPNEFSADIKQDTLPPAAFVIYRQKIKEAEAETVYYNPEAWNILSQSLLLSDKKTTVAPDINALCLKWKNSFDKIQKEAGGNHELGDMVNYCVDMFESYRRKYIVRATVLVNNHSLQTPTKQHLFILERLSPQNVNLSATFRRWNLSPREQQIAKLLIEDRSNKEIARILGLSANTVKVYIRFLMKKLDVASRTGIVSKVLSERV
jgi:DNA-binding CsgD family transcriptional regulator